MGDPVRLFVYGTLRGGGAHNDLLRDAVFVRDACLEGTLYHLGAYPAMVPHGDGPVHGEIWECTVETLRRLDTYEGVGEGLFIRARVDFQNGKVWVYLAGPALDSRISGAPRIDTGRWPDQPPDQI